MSSLRNSAKKDNWVKRVRRCKVAALVGAPHKKAVVKKLAVTTPRKPNSAKRRYVKISVITTGKVVHAKVPGRGKPEIQEYSVVMFEGGSPKDTPGVNYTLIRGKLDFDKEEEDPKRMKSRSKFGLKTKNI